MNERIITGRFIFCVEQGRLEREAVLLCESIRKFGGRLADAPITGFSPRPDRRVNERIKRALKELNVDIVDEPLNTAFPEYGPGNKIFSCAWAEENYDEDILIFIDSDQVILSEPMELLGVKGREVFLQPVDIKNVGATDEDDKFYKLWTRLFKEYGIVAPVTVRTKVTGEQIFGYWNSGLIAARQDAGLFLAWRELFMSMMGAKLWSSEGEAMFHADQVSLALLIMQNKFSYKKLSKGYNYPLPHHDRLASSEKCEALDQIATLHYHGEFDGAYRGRFFEKWDDFDRESERRSWLTERAAKLGFGRERNILQSFLRRLKKIVSKE